MSLLSTLQSPTEVRHIESTGRSTSELASKEHFREMNYLFKKVVSAHTSAWKIYGNKVDAEQLKIPDYYNVIRKPMYLKKVEKKLQRALEGREKGYTNVGKVVADIRLALRNAELYNGPMIEVVKTCGAAMHIVLMKEVRATSMPCPNRASSPFSVFYASPHA